MLTIIIIFCAAFAATIVWAGVCVIASNADRRMKRLPDKPPDLLTECAWCVKEHGIKPTKGASHGICKRHHEEVMREFGLN